MFLVRCVYSDGGGGVARGVYRNMGVRMFAHCPGRGCGGLLQIGSAAVPLSRFLMKYRVVCVRVAWRVSFSQP